VKLLQLQNLIEETTRPALAIRVLFAMIETANQDGFVELDRVDICSVAGVDPTTQINNFSQVCNELCKLNLLEFCYQDAAGELHQKRGRGRKVKYKVPGKVLSLFSLHSK